MLEFSGRFFAIPANLKSASSFSRNIWFNIAGSFSQFLPKYCSATLSVITISSGDFRAVLGFPFIKSKSNTLNTLLSVSNILCPKVFIPFFKTPPQLPKRTVFAISGKSFCNAGANGPGVTATLYKVPAWFCFSVIR